MRMVVPAGLASASWDRERLDAVERLEVESLLPLFWAAEVERLAAGSRPSSEWVYPNELPSFP